MQRRGFLGALMGLAAAPAIARLEPLIGDASKAIILPALTPSGVGLADRLEFYNRGPHFAECGLWRMPQVGAPKLMQTAGLGPNCGWLWRAHPGMEIVFTPEHPVVAMLPQHGEGWMFYTAGGERWVRQFLPNGGAIDLPVNPPRRTT